MSTTDLIERLEQLAVITTYDDYVVPRDLTQTLYRAAAVIRLLRDEVKYLLDKEREI